MVVRRDLVKDDLLAGEYQRCILADGSHIEVPTATPYFSGKVVC